MNNQEVKRYFNEYIIPPKGFIYNDIKREIDLAREGQGGANFLSALGLLCYTEFMGKILENGRYISHKYWFNSFLKSMGRQYRRLIDIDRLNIYGDLRCGMAHSYFAENCEIKMLNDSFAAGIVVKPDGRYLFIVEKYFEDFISACQELYSSLLSEQKPYLQAT